MAIDVAEILSKMLNAAQKEFGSKWPGVKDYAESEFKKLAENFATIEKLKLQGKVTEEQAKLLLDIQKNSARMVLLTIEGLGLLTVEAAINAALNVVKDVVNSALGIVLI
ncbi:MAG: hypothetical protein ACE5HO_18690 [bacterium]